jgi:hypothetical protein
VSDLDVCEACSDRRYIHIDYDGTGMPEIERCDMCCNGVLDDEDAAALHRVYCGCACPEISEGRKGTEGEVVHAGTMMPFATFDRSAFDYAVDRLSFHGLSINTTKGDDRVEA